MLKYGTLISFGFKELVPFLLRIFLAPRRSFRRLRRTCSGWVDAIVGIDLRHFIDDVLEIIFVCYIVQYLLGKESYYLLLLTRIDVSIVFLGEKLLRIRLNKIE